MKVFDLFSRYLSGLGRKQYASHASAMGDSSAGGYENPEIIEVVFRKTVRYRDELSAGARSIDLSATNAYSLCALLAAGKSSEINVIDFGGACGAHYFLARAVLPQTWRLKWVVVETPAMARAAAVLSSEELSFSSDLATAAASMSPIHLVHTSGTLQCVDKPYEYLGQIIATCADYVFFNRLGLTRGRHDVITVHEARLSWNGPGPMPGGLEDKTVRHPCSFLREGAFFEVLKRGYDVVFRFSDETGVFPVGTEPLIGIGLLASRKNPG